MNKSNVPPFYVGQKVVALADGRNGFGMTLKKGTVVTVEGLISCECGIWYIQFGNALVVGPHFHCCVCCRMCQADMSKYAGESKYFAPLQEQPAQYVEYSRVVEECRELVNSN